MHRCLCGRFFSLALGLIFGGCLLALHRAVWVLLPLLLTEMSLANYIIPDLGVSALLAATLCAGLLASVVILREGRFGQLSFGRVLWPAAALLLPATLVNSLH